MPIPSPLNVGRTRSGYRIRVEGRGTLREGPAVLGLFVVQLLDDVACTVVVDLSPCEDLDGRFLGSLLDLQRHYGHGRPPRFSIAMAPEARRRLLSRTPALALLKVVRECPEVLGEEAPLPSPVVGTSDLDLHLREWHLRLASLEGTGRVPHGRRVNPPAYEPVYL